MDISEHLDWSINSQYHRLLFNDLLAFISKGDNVLSSESEISISIILSWPLSRPEEVVQEQGIEGINRVNLLVLWVLTFLGSCQLVLLFFKLVKWDVLSFFARASMNFNFSDSDFFCSGDSWKWGCVGSTSIRGRGWASVLSPLCAWGWRSTTSANSLFQLLIKIGEIFEKLSQINLHYWVCWNIWSLILEPSMHEDYWVYRPYSMSKPLQWVELLPFGALSFINF